MFTNHTKKDLKYFFLHSYLLSIVSYVIYTLIFKHNSFFKNLLNPKSEINLYEIVQVSIIGLILGLIFTYIINYKLLYKFGHLIRVTKKYGDEEVWESVVSDSISSWVTIRDKNRGLTYLGKIIHFSDIHNKRELALTEVDIYSDEGEYLHSQDSIYFDFASGENIVIELGNSYINSSEDGVND